MQQLYDRWIDNTSFQILTGMALNSTEQMLYLIVSKYAVLLIRGVHI